MNKKMTVSTFATQYINCKKESDRNSLVRSIIKRSYVPVTEKVSIIQELLGVAFDEKDGLKIPNALCLHVNFHIIILSLYTDLEIDKKENDRTAGFRAYDIFQSCELWNVLKRQIGADYKELEKIRDLYLENMATENDLVVQLSNQITRFGTLISLAFRPLANTIQSEMNNLNESQKDNFKSSMIKILK